MLTRNTCFISDLYSRVQHEDFIKRTVFWYVLNRGKNKRHVPTLSTCINKNRDQKQHYDSTEKHQSRSDKTYRIKYFCFISKYCSCNTVVAIKQREPRLKFLYTWNLGGEKRRIGRGERWRFTLPCDAQRLMNRYGIEFLLIRLFVIQTNIGGSLTKWF